MQQYGATPAPGHRSGWGVVVTGRYQPRPHGLAAFPARSLAPAFPHPWRWVKGAARRIGVDPGRMMAGLLRRVIQVAATIGARGTRRRGIPLFQQRPPLVA